MSDSILKQQKFVNPVHRYVPGEEITYLLLVKQINSDETFWEIIKGRVEAYDYIKNNIDIIDPEQSFIVANNTKINLENMHTLYDFVKYVKKENDIVDEFDIDDWKPNVDTSMNIGIGLESAGSVFTGIAGSFTEDDE